MLRCGDEAQGSEAAAVVGLSPTHLIGRPLVARYGRLVPAEPCRLRLEAGRIAACWPLDASRLPRDAVIVGDADALLLPAFADPHIHLVACAADRAGIDLSDDPPATHAQLLDRLRVAATLLPAGTWLRVSGYDEAWLEERGHPTRAELDDALPRHPLRLRHATRHATVLNSLGWARVEETLGVPSPDRAPRAADGSPLGPVFGLEPEITRMVGPIEPAALAQGLRVVGGTLARLGIVHLDEVTASNDAARVKRLADAVAAGDLPQRVRAFVGDADEAEPARHAAADVVTVAGVKLVARSTDEVHGREFVDRLQRARRCGLPVAVHAVEPDVIVAVLDALAAAPTRARAMDVPDRIEHASLCPPEVAQRIARARVAVVTQPAFVAWRGDKYRREVEAPLHEWLYPLRDLRAAGVLVAAGSDAPVVPLDPRLALDGAVRRTTRDGDVIGPGQSLDEGAALDLITGAPARLRGESAPHGLVAGAVADVLVVDADTWAERWRGLRVLHTLAAGRVIA